MAEVAAIPWNGFKVASLFAGCGGSCLGYRMAGFRVVWANEFVRAAVDSYRANMEPETVLDSRDVRLVNPEDILTAAKLKAGELDVLDGSPPCQAFSTAGKRDKGWGKGTRYENGATQRNEDMFTEYVRLLAGLKPKVFVAENVSGLVKGVAKGYFLDILAELKACGYRVGCKILDAQWLGVPQQRQRVIFIGVREDLNLEPAHPLPLPYRYSVRDALPWIVSSSDDGFPKNKNGKPASEPARAARAARAVNCIARVIHDTGGQKETRFVKNKDVTDQPCPTITNGIGGMNSCHFKVESETVISGCIGTGYKRRQMPTGKPCLAIQATGAAQTRFEIGTEKRKFTIAELRRICAFPDDFILTGSYAQQWERLGNSVPPVMMFHIAKTIRDEILCKIK